VVHSTRRIFERVFFLAILIALGAGAGLAQSTFGSFVGTVKDQSGAVVSGCTVVVKNLGTSAERTTTTDSTGSYTVVNIEPGTYEITMEMRGFQRAEYNNLPLLARQTVRIDGALALGTQAQVVEISTAQEAPINTEVSNITESKTGRELIDLPVAIASRALGSTSAMTTLTTQAGVEIDNSGNISVAGGKPSMLSISIDGISTMSPRNSAPISELFPAFDGIAEIRVSEINNTAEFSGISDITTVSKSGTNDFHGGLFENHQNSAFAARNTFSATVPKLIMNDFGGFIGGPVIVPKLYHGKDKTFFFMTYEGLRLPRETVLTESVPSLALRTGDLSVYLPKVVRDLSGNPFPNNKIPASFISPMALAALKYLFPLPNAGGPNAIANNYVDNYPSPISSNQGDVRLDQNINDKQTVFARLTYKRRDVENAPTASVLTGPTLAPENDWSLTGAYNYVISPSIVNELRVGWTGSHAATIPGIDASTIAGQVGILPYLQQDLTGVNTNPNFKISGFQATGGSYSSLSNTQTTQILDNLTLTRGHHNVKIGADYRYLSALFTDAFGFDFLGVYTFNNSVTSIINNPYAAFLLGVPDNDTLARTLQPNTQGYASSFGTYIQDDWKVTPRFTINYGLRWEYHPMFGDHLYNTANFLPNTSSVINGQVVQGTVVVPDQGLHQVIPSFAQSIAPIPVVTASQAGIPQVLRYAQKTDFAPRVGFAWRVTNDGKTVIRGGYGKFIETTLGQLVSGAWGVESSDVGQFNNKITNGQAQLTFPYPFPANLAQPGSQAFQYSYSLHYQDPYVQQWNFTLERDLGFQTGLRVSYDGSHGSNLGVFNDLTQVPANTVGYAQAKLTGPYPTFAAINNFENGGVSNYQSLTVSANKRLSKGVQFTASYNFAKNLSDVGGYNPTSFASSGGGYVSNSYDPYLDYGNVPYTRRQRFLATFLYEITSHTNSRLINQLAGGWELSGVLTFQTGPFLTVLAPGADPSGTNFANSYDNSTGAARADINPGVSIVPANQSIQQWINPGAFAIPQNNIGRFGDSQVGAVVGPGTQTVALSLYRSFKLNERIALRLGASASNLFNHPNYGVPNLTLGTSPYGTISSLQSAEGAGPRAVQLGGRLTF
jgi:Carboxypeptidase regulatory-like domain/TonB dependent receptor